MNEEKVLLITLQYFMWWNYFFLLWHGPVSMAIGVYPQKMKEKHILFFM